eukprot:gene8641-34089_t
MLKSSDRVAHDIDILRRQPGLATCPSEEAGHAELPPATSALAAMSIEEADSDMSPPSAGSSADPGPASVAIAPAGQTSIRPVLVLRKWYDLRPEREFRCFVGASELVGVCQRDVSQHFPQLSFGPELRRMRRDIKSFHVAHVKTAFPLRNYTYDVYVATNGSVKLMDFGPMDDSTSPLLFSWEELGLGVAGIATPALESHEQQAVAEPAGYVAGGEDGGSSSDEDELEGSSSDGDYWMSFFSDRANTLDQCILTALTGPMSDVAGGEDGGSSSDEDESERSSSDEDAAHGDIESLTRPALRIVTPGGGMSVGQRMA